MKTIIITGLSLGIAKNMTGIQRSCHELIYRLDTLLENEKEINVKYIYNVAALNEIIKPEELKNISLIPVKSDGKKYWKTRIVRKYVNKENAILCCLSLETALVRNQISFIYDIRPATTKYDNLKFRTKYKIFMILQKFNTQIILTDSEYQKHAIANYLKISPNKIKTIYMGYEHTERIMSDYKIFEKFPELKNSNYYYTLGSLAPHKNVKWVKEVAIRNPDSIFVIAGGKDLYLWKDNVEEKGIKNLLFVGQITDGESKALMMKCSAFIHPSKYEGFGIPPLEALSYGKKIFISNATCLPEIYEDCAVYFSPDDYDVDLNEMLNTKVENPSKIFSKCSWDKSAKELLEVLKNAKEN